MDQHGRHASTAQVLPRADLLLATLMATSLDWASNIAAEGAHRRSEFNSDTPHDDIAWMGPHSANVDGLRSGQ